MMKCPFCGKEECYQVFQQKLPLFLSAVPKVRAHLNSMHDMTVEFCPNCGLGFNSSPLSDLELEKIYDGYIYINPFENIGSSHFTHIIDMIKKHSGYDSKIVEIGSSIGYLLAALRDLGYKNLLGIDPSPQSETAAGKGLNILKEYYSADSFKEGADIFVLRHVFEHFNEPFEIFRGMVSQVEEKGYIVIETPNFDGFHHQHLYFYSLPFYRKLAEKYGIRLVDYDVYEGNIVAVFSNSASSADGEGETPEDLANRAKLKQKAMEEHLNKFRDFVKKYKEIYLWGTGSFAIILLSGLKESELKDKVIIPIDTDMNRSGYMLANITESVRHAKDMAGSKPEALAIASQFTGEIKRLMASLDIIPEDVLEFFP